jgi:hypothetical protein
VLNVKAAPAQKAGEQLAVNHVTRTTQALIKILNIDLNLWKKKK